MTAQPRIGAQWTFEIHAASSRELGQSCGAQRLGRDIDGKNRRRNRYPRSVSTAVRQTPLTAMLSPARSSAPSVELTRTRRPLSVALTVSTVPVASISPVNIALHQSVAAERDFAAPTSRQFASSGVPGRRNALAKHLLRPDPL